MSDIQDNEHDYDFKPEQLNFRFTGKVYMSTLRQTIYWQDIVGRSHQILEMDTDYLENVKRYLERNSTRFYQKYMEMQYYNLPERDAEKYPEVMEDYLEQSLNPDINRVSKWLFNLPVYKAIEAEIEKRYDGYTL